MTAKNGDDFLSGYERELWELCYSTLLNFGCPTMFRRDKPNVPLKLDERIIFMVPRGHSRAGEVVAYLRDEAKRFFLWPRWVGTYALFNCKR